MPTISNIINVSKATHKIFKRAGNKMFKSSLLMTGQIAYLYKDAGLKTLQLGKNVVVKSVDLALKNQKEILKTSGSALREVVETIKDRNVTIKVKLNGRKGLLKNKSGRTVEDEEVTIDDMFE